MTSTEVIEQIGARLARRVALARRPHARRLRRYTSDRSSGGRRSYST